MKALEMLYRDKKWIEEECDISKIPIERVQTTIKDLVEINEAIAELEALQQPKRCDGCWYFRNNDKACFESSQNTYIRPASISFSGCGKFEPKNNTCL